MKLMGACKLMDKPDKQINSLSYLASKMLQSITEDSIPQSFLIIPSFDGGMYKTCIKLEIMHNYTSFP